MLLASQLLTITNGWLTHYNSELMELTAEEADAEEEDNKKETEDTFKPNFNAHEYIGSPSTSNTSMRDELRSLHHLEISTPPPEFINSIS